MIVYGYDGSFEGLYTAIDISADEKQVPDEIIAASNKQWCLGIMRSISTDVKRARLCMDRFKEKTTERSLRNTYYVHLSNAESRELAILSYVRFGFNVGKVLDDYWTDERVQKIHKNAIKVIRESHRMKGFVRFKKSNDSALLAEIETDHFVLPLIAPFFARRLAHERWMIIDRIRHRAACYSGGHWDIIDAGGVLLRDISSAEKLCQQLWKTYFASISIHERTNARLQRHNMPQKYWTHLTELS